MIIDLTNIGGALMSSKYRMRYGPNGPIPILEFKLNLLRASGDTIDRSLAKTYQTKPLFEIDGQAVFGEIAVLMLLRRDGWDGVWVDTFHSNKQHPLFWNRMLPSPKVAVPDSTRNLYNEIVRANGDRAAGFFDVMVWRGSVHIFVEFKGPGDRANANEKSWILAAQNSRIDPAHLFYVSCQNKNNIVKN